MRACDEDASHRYHAAGDCQDRTDGQKYTPKNCNACIFALALVKFSPKLPSF